MAQRPLRGARSLQRVWSVCVQADEEGEPEGVAVGHGVNAVRTVTLWEDIMVSVINLV